MSNFKIFGGIYEDEKGILDAESILYASLEDNRVVLATKYNTEHSFATDLTTIEQVRICLAKETECIFTLATIRERISFAESEIGQPMKKEELHQLGLKREKASGFIVPIQYDEE